VKPMHDRSDLYHACPEATFGSKVVTLTPGATFGEICLIEPDSKRTATVAVDPSVASANFIVLSQSSYTKMSQSQKQAVRTLLELLSLMFLSTIYLYIYIYIYSVCGAFDGRRNESRYAQIYVNACLAFWHDIS
jgi:hypothetical protein